MHLIKAQDAPFDIVSPQGGICATSLPGHAAHYLRLRHLVQTLQERHAESQLRVHGLVSAQSAQRAIKPAFAQAAFSWPAKDGHLRIQMAYINYTNAAIRHAGSMRGCIRDYAVSATDRYVDVKMDFIHAFESAANEACRIADKIQGILPREYDMQLNDTSQDNDPLALAFIGDFYYASDRRLDMITHLLNYSEFLMAQNEAYARSGGPQFNLQSYAENVMRDEELCAAAHELTTEGYDLVKLLLRSIKGPEAGLAC